MAIAGDKFADEAYALARRPREVSKVDPSMVAVYLSVKSRSCLV